MKTKTKCFTLLALIAAFWGTAWVAFQHGFRQGYAQGSRDEFYCWEQEPSTRGDLKVTGRRDMRRLLGGKTVAQPVRAPNPTFMLDLQTGNAVRKS